MMIGEKILEGLEQAVRHARGEESDVEVRTVTVRGDIAQRIRIGRCKLEPPLKSSFVFPAEPPQCQPKARICPVRTQSPEDKQ